MIRRATLDDAPAIGGLFVRPRDEMTYLPRIPEHDRPLLGGWFLARAGTLGGGEGRIVGFAEVSGDELTHLYTDPPAQNRVGTALLDHMRSLRPERLELVGVPKERWCSHVL